MNIKIYFVLQKENNKVNEKAPLKNNFITAEDLRRSTYVWHKNQLKCNFLNETYNVPW